MPNVYVARKRLQIDGSWREIGDEVPEAASWRNLHSYLSSGAIVLVQTDDVKAYGMNQRIPVDDQLDVATARVGATHHDQLAGWGDQPPAPEPEAEPEPEPEPAPPPRRMRVRKAPAPEPAPEPEPEPEPQVPTEEQP